MRHDITPKAVAEAASASVFGRATDEHEATLQRLREAAVPEVPLQRPEDVTEPDTYGAGEHGDVFAGDLTDRDEIASNVAALYELTPETLENGSTNFENTQILGLLDTCRIGRAFSDAEAALYRQLMAAHGAEVAALRKVADPGPPENRAPDPGPGRLSESDTMSAEEQRTLGMVPMRHTAPAVDPTAADIGAGLASDGVPLAKAPTSTTTPRGPLPDELQTALDEHDRTMPDERLGMRDPS